MPKRVFKANFWTINTRIRIREAGELFHIRVPKFFTATKEMSTQPEYYRYSIGRSMAVAEHVLDQIEQAN